MNLLHTCRICLHNVPANRRYGLFTSAGIQENLAARLNKLLLVPMERGDGLSEEDVEALLLVLKASYTICKRLLS